MASSQGSDKGFELDNKDKFNIVYALARGYTTCFVVFFRKNFGKEALAWPGLIGASIMLAVGSFGRIPEMWSFFGIWLLAMACHRVSTMRALQQGVIRHSRYEGDVDTKLIKSRTTVKLVLEPLVCLLFAVLCQFIGLSHGFAMFFVCGAFALFLVAAIDQQLDNKRLEAMRDAAIEQSYLASRYRGETEDL